MPAGVSALAARPLDRLLLAILLPVWFAVFSLHVWAVFYTGLAQPGFFIINPAADEYPQIGGLRPEQGSATGGLRVGDRLRRAGARDLKGVGNIAFDAAAITEAGPSGSVSIEFERNHQRESVELRLVPLAAPWMRIPMLIAFASTGVIVLLRGGGSLHARFMYAAFMSVAILQSPFHGVSYAATVASKAMFYAGNILVPPLIFTWLLFFPPGLPPPRPATLWVPWLFMPIAALVRGSYVFGGPIPPAAAPIMAPVLDGLVVAISIGLLTWNFRRVDQTGRRRIKWVLYGAYLAGVPVAVMLFSVVADPSGAWYRTALIAPAIGACALPLGVLIAVVRHNLLDIDRLIGATTSYSVLAVLLAAATLYAVPLAAGQISGVFGVSPPASQALMSLLIAAIAIPLYQRVRPTIDRMLFPERHAFEEGIRHLLSELSSSDSPDALTARVGSELVRLLRPATCVVYRRSGAAFTPVFARGAEAKPIELSDPLVAVLERRMSPVAADRSGSHRRDQGLSAYERAALEELKVSVVAPVRGRQGLAAMFSLGPKRSGDVYTSTEVAWLSGVADRMSAGLTRFEDTAFDQPTATAVRLPVEAGPRSVTLLQECRSCGRCFDSNMTVCDRDGTVLTRNRIARVLSDRYRLDRRLGKGGMGTVYEAVDLALSRTVAVKIIRDDAAANHDAGERFQREARATAAFAHPNVVVVHDFGVTKAGTPYLVLELLKGMTLREELTRVKRLPVRRVLAVTRTLCEVLDIAHRQALVHRDLKPENVFLSISDGRETIKVLDFGLAKFKHGGDTREIETTPGMLVGTLAYMAPECFDLSDVHPSWDLWSLAVMVYEMLCGVRPFTGDASAIQSAVRAGQFPGLAQYWPDAPSRLQAFMSRSLSTVRSVRPTSAHEFVAAFADAAGD